ncbi:MAG: methyltransferase [Paludibacteraceae bacterium]|nr:methyltransferase [Paludibacteraceae bacterium]
MNTGFRFKQFFVRHDRCAMKVGTDGVLLGCWVFGSQELRAKKQERILDIGTGSGLIALMLAQRYAEAQIDAIDIDADAVEQARENFAASPWADRLHAAQCALQELRAESRERKYDLIVSNPPYFVDSLKNPDAARRTARHNDTLPFGTLIAESVRLLAANGTLALIIPTEAEDELQRLAAEHGLQCVKRCYVHPKPGRPAKRVMIAWTGGDQLRNASATIGGTTEHLTLEDEQGGRSEAYRELTKDYYL